MKAKIAFSAAARLLGSTSHKNKSASQAAASRKNGKRGGRPRKERNENKSPLPFGVHRASDPTTKEKRGEIEINNKPRPQGRKENMKTDQEKLLNTLQEIGEIAENCLHGTTPLIAEQVFGSPLRNIRRLAFEAVESQTEPRPDLVIPCAGCGQTATVEPGTGSIPLCGVCSDLFDGVHGGEQLLVMFDKETAKEIEIGGVQ